MPRFLLVILGLAAAVLTAAAAPPPAANLQAARSAYFQMRVGEAERLFKAVLDDPSAAPADAAGAARGLARIQWLVDADAAAAEATLQKGLATNADLCATTGYYVRVLREAGHPQAGADLAVRRASDCPGAAFGDRLLIERGKAELAWAAREPTGPGLGRARATLAALSPTGRLTPDAARLRLGVGLMGHDPDMALDAWKGFFWLSDRNAPESFKAGDAAVAAAFRGALAPKPDLAQEIAMERLLIRGGFLTEAERFDAEHGMAARAANDPAYRPVANYLDFRRRFDALTLTFNRANARGRREANYFAEALKIGNETAAALGRKDTEAALAEAYGLHWMSGNTGGVPSIHMGHIVEDRRIEVEQFGRRAELRFISIDNLVSNGFQSWLWDGQAATGGWSEDAAIVQVRASYTPGIMESLAGFDPEVAAKSAAELPKLEARDAEIARGKAPAYLPGLQRRLRDQSRDQIAAKARAEAQRTGEPFERVFQKVAWDATVGNSIDVHEGRHALDKAEYRGAAALSSPELEYRAKLSELQLAEFPKLALVTILSADVGSDTPHGQADARIMKGLTDWIEVHRAEVAGYDPQSPTAAQIDKLSDAQLRVIAHDMDPQFKPH